MAGGLRPRCTVCGKSRKSCGGCADGKLSAQTQVKSRKRHHSAEVDRELAKEIEVIKKKIKTVKVQGAKSVEVKAKKIKTDKESGPRTRQRSEVYQRFQAMMDQKMNDQNNQKMNEKNKAGLKHQTIPKSSPRKHPYNLRSGFWMQEAKTPAPPLSFLPSLSNNSSEPKFTPKYASQDQCCHLKRKDELNSPDISQGFMHKVDMLLKKARLDTSKVSKLKL